MRDAGSPPQLPEDIRQQLRRAERLEWWTLFWLVSIIAVMYLAMGSSQAMKTAWIEDTLSLLPPILFLAARRCEQLPPTRAFPFGFQRAGTLPFFLAAAAALTLMGGFLLYSAASHLITQEHPTIGSVRLLGQDIWLGWVMIAALVYSIIPPVIPGRMKKPLAHATMDKVLYTDADMNAADWKTGVAGIAELTGIAFGYWWADAAAAGVIAFDILRDGLRNFRIALAELLDGAPRNLASAEVHPISARLSAQLRQRYPHHRLRLREAGRFVFGELVEEEQTQERGEAAGQAAGEEDGWRLLMLSRQVPLAEPERRRQTDENG
ncbi:cation transporter [Roseobacteraceae bacterium NS-SX3]